jgi:hypothetical protein
VTNFVSEPEDEREDILVNVTYGDISRAASGRRSMGGEAGIQLLRSMEIGLIFRERFLEDVKYAQGGALTSQHEEDTLVIFE